MQTSIAAFEQAIRNEGTKPYLIKIAALVLLYVSVAQLGLSLAFSTPYATTVWPPTGIALTALLIWGYHYAPAIFVGALMANVIQGAPALAASGMALGNTLEAVLGVFLIHRFIQGSKILEKIINVILFVLLVAFLSTAVSASIGVLSLLAGGVIPAGQFARTWLIWWVGDMLSALIIVPLVMAWRNRQYRTFFVDNLFESMFVLVLVATACLVIFSQPPHTSHITSRIIYLIFPLIIWAAVRLTQVGAATAGTIITIAAVWGTLVGTGPYTRGSSIEENLIYLHLFIVVIMLTGLILAVAVAARLSTEAALRKKTAELEKAQREILHNIKWRKDLQNQVKDATEKIGSILSNILEERTKK